MKKLIIAAAIACAAIFAQAAAIDWSASAVLDPVATAAAGKNTAGVGWLGYVVLGADLADVKAGLDAGNTATLVSKAVGPTKTTNNKGAFGADSASGAVAAGSQDFYLIVLNSTSTSGATGYVVSSKVTETVDASLDTLISFGSMASATKNASSWTTMSVPEPTSGLLLLLGVAGLALKRKRA